MYKILAIILMVTPVGIVCADTTSITHTPFTLHDFVSVQATVTTVVDDEAGTVTTKVHTDQVIGLDDMTGEKRSLQARITRLQAKVAEMEARVVQLTADIAAAEALGIVSFADGD